MSVVGSATEKIDVRSKREFGDNHREYTRAFIAETSLRTDDPTIALTAVGLPAYYSTYNTETHTDLAAICYQRDARQNPINPLLWDITCLYSTTILELSVAVSDDPLLEPPDIDFSFESSPRALYGFPDPQQAYTGGGVPATASGVVNSAGEPFDPPVEIEASRPVLTISRNEPLFFPAVAVRFQDTVNADVFWSVNPHVARVKGIRGVKQRKKGIGYWRVTYTIAFNRETWDPQPADVGTYYIDASDGDKKKKFLTDEGVARIGNLTEDGDDGGTTLRFLKFDKAYRAEQFSLLNLPTIGQVNFGL